MSLAPHTNITKYSDAPNIIYQKYLRVFDYQTLIKRIMRDHPNHKRTSYKDHAMTSQLDRLYIGEEMAKALHEHFVKRQPPGYPQKTKGRPVYLPRYEEVRAMELITDYILADDHVKGLSIGREPVEIAESNYDEYPPLGEGARDFLDTYIERNFIGWPYTIGEKRELKKLVPRVKRCEICDSYFIDQTKPRNAKRCGPSCTKEHERRRQRGIYNDNVHDLDDERRRKRQRERQQHEYPFYSPQEMDEISRRGEIVKAAEDFERGRIAKKMNPELDFGGRKAVKHKSLSEIESSGNWNKKQPKHDPHGIDRRKAYDIKWGTVATYRIEDMTDAKFVEASQIRRLFQ